jgi:peptidoglycan/LPS O-acetylase OafA/YrhL
MWGEKLSAKNKSRRLDIQGLRAIAVLSEVAFHYGLALPGGFMGVDVFFVISGYVITLSLWERKVRGGGLYLGQFYVRRFKRLTPALALMLVMTLMVSFLILSPIGALDNALSTSVGAATWTANFVISKTTGSYFSLPAASNPLLHTWSLSVEDQFYLVLPAVVLVTFLLARNDFNRRLFFGLLIGAGALFSFAFAIHSLGALDPGARFLTSFYSPLNRFWEFAIGAAIVILPNWSIRQWLREALAIFSVLILCGSLIFVTQDLPLPGWFSLPAIIATAVLLIAGRGGTTFVGKFLSRPPFALIGDWSYSIYLWHWPFIVLTLAVWPEAQDLLVLSALASFIPAILSYKFVEQPARSRPWGRRPVAVTLALLLIGLPILAGLGLKVWNDDIRVPQYQNNSLPSLLIGDIGHAEFHAYVDQNYFPCTPEGVFAAAPRWEGIPRCHQSKSDSAPRVALFGDSHSEELFLGFAEAVPHMNIVYYMQPELPVGDRPLMENIYQQIISSSTIETVIISAHWVARGVPEDELEESLRGIVSSGKRVVVLDDHIDFPFEPSGCKFSESLIIKPKCTVTIQYERRRQATYMPALNKVVSKIPEARMVKISDYFCDLTTCSMALGETIMFRDGQHLNMPGSRFVVKEILTKNPWLRRLLDWRDKFETIPRGN